MAPRLREHGEFGLIRRLVAGLSSGADVPVGPGDDAAVVRPELGRDLVVTTDAFVAGRHWQPDWIAPRALGQRLALANLSDLAAMAARPRWALLSLGLRADGEVAWVEELQQGVVAALARDGASLVGGNLSAVSDEPWLSLALIGDVAPGRAWTRSGARPGDRLAVTGCPGRAGAAVALLRTFGAAAHAPEWAPLLAAWRSPVSRVDLARALAASGAVTASVDLSDGFAADLRHLCEASGAGVTIERERWPADPAIVAAARALNGDADALRVGPSDDYELLIAVAPDGAGRCAAIAAEAGVALTFVGTFTGARGVLEWQARDGSHAPLAAPGFDHFG